MAIPTAVATGVLIDADHVPDYYLWYWKRDRRRIFVPLHAWEFVIAGLVMLLVAWHGPVILAAVLGYLGHLTSDQLRNRLAHPLTYSILFRLYARFDRVRLAGDVPETFEEAFHMVPLWGVIGPRVTALVYRLGLGPEVGGRSSQPDLPSEGEG